MKRTTQIIYILLFVLAIGIGTVCNFPKLYRISKDIIKEEKYAAWPILIGLEYTDEFFDKYFFVNVNGYFHKVLGQRTMKDVVKTDSGAIVYLIGDVVVWEQVQKTIDFYQWLREEGIEFSFVQVPYHICKYETGLPSGIKDYSATIEDTFLLGMEMSDIPHLDLREVLHNAGINHEEAYFKTDHHWKIETAFWAYGIMVDFLEEKLSVEIPEKYTNPDSFTWETFEDYWLGSNGRRTGIAYAGLDDLTLIYPKFPTNLKFEAKEKNIYREGSFQESYMDYEQLEGDNLYEMQQYDVYIGKDYPTTTQINENAPSDKKILLIKDSYFRPVSAFLGLAFSRVDSIDMRYYEGSVKKYIEEMEPDIVLICYHSYMIMDKDHFRFLE